MKKTIFISLSSSPVFRNLFFFPGCFFDDLKKKVREDKDLELVFVIPDEHYEKYAALFQDAGDRVRVARIASGYRRMGLLQRLFRFFYSYLIFTNTTKLLATMGTRPDEMPPGNRFLAPLKAGIAATFGRSRAMKTRVIPHLFNLIFQRRPFAPLLAQYQPDLVFLPNLYGFFDTVFARDAREQGIKTVGMTANWDHIDKYFIPIQTDFFLAQNYQVREGAIRYQAYSAGIISVVGYPHLDFLFRKEFLIPRQELLKSLNFPPEAKFILYISGSVYCPDEPEVIGEVIGWADRGGFSSDVRMVIRPYLGGRFKDKDFDDKKFNALANHPRVAVYERESWKDLPGTTYLLNLMYHADVVMSAFSTAALEVSLFDRPLISIGFDGHHTRPLHRSVRRFEQFSHFQDIFSTGAIRIARSFDELFSMIDAYLKNPQLDAQARDHLREKICGTLDGRASHRILTEVLEKGMAA